MKIDLKEKANRTTFKLDYKQGFGPESYCSMVSRLCWKYSIPPIKFFNRFLKEGSPVTRSFFHYEVASHLNSCTKKSMEYDKKIKSIIDIGPKEVHSYLYLSDVIDNQARDLISERKRWCPLCYRDRIYNLENRPDHDNGVYDDLCWSMSSIKSCLAHGVGLIDKCANCHHHQPYISTTIEPGFCHNCQAFLGSGVSPSLSEEDLFFQKEAFSLFYVHTFLDKPISILALTENLKALKRVYPEANSSYIGELMGTSPDVVRKWIRGVKKPRISSLFALQRALGLSGPHQLLYKDDIFINKVVFSRALPLRFNARNKYGVMLKNKQIFERFTEIFDHRSQTVSRSQLAEELDVSEGYLQSSFSSQCTQLSAMHQARLQQEREERHNDAIHKLMKILGELRSRKKGWRSELIKSTVKSKDLELYKILFESDLTRAVHRAKELLFRIDEEKRHLRKQRSWQR